MARVDKDLAALACAVALTAAPAVARAACTKDVAAGIYAGARRAFDEKRYDDSVTLLRRAYECDANSVYLHNIARAYEEANRPKEALAAWQAYLQVVPTERERVQVLGRISSLSKMIDDLDRLEREKNAAEEARRKAEADAAARPAPFPPAATSEPPAAPPPPPLSPPRHVATGAWLTAGAGAAGLVGGGVLGVLSIAKHDAAVSEPNVVQAESLQGNARDLARSANWAFALGGAVAAVGVTWICVYLLTPARASGPTVGVALDGAGITLRGAL